MKILYIANCIIPSRTANSIHIMKMCNALSTLGHHVTLVTAKYPHLEETGVDDCYDYYGVERKFDINFITIPRIKGGIYFYVAKLIPFFLKNSFDFVLGRFIFGCFLSSLFRNYTVFESHAPIWNSSWSERLAFRLMIKSKYFKNLIVISEALKLMYIKNASLENSMVSVYHDGADEQKHFNGILPETTNLRVGYFGHLYRGRGVEVILELATSLPDIEFHIVGGTNEDISHWKSQCLSENLFFHGFVHPKVVFEYRNSCDILIAPYQNSVATFGGKGDTSQFMSPLKVFEYMSSKKPIIISNLPVLREVLDDDTAIFVAPMDSNEWRSAILKLKDSNRSNFLANNAYAKFLHYTWKSRAKDIISQFCENQ
jgi:glycosyltransferase involved in cell wall biosynthesis